MLKFDEIKKKLNAPLSSLLSPLSSLFSLLSSRRERIGSKERERKWRKNGEVDARGRRERSGVNIYEGAQIERKERELNGERDCRL